MARPNHETAFDSLPAVRRSAWRPDGLVSLTVLAGLAAGLGIAVPALPARAVTLEEVVQKAVDSHPEVGAIRANRRAISQELRAARGAYLPSVDLRGAWGHEWVNSPSTRTRPGRRNGENGWVDMNRYELGVNLRQLVFDGFGTDFEVKRQKGRVSSARWRVMDTAQAIGLRAIEAYLEVQRTRRIVAIAGRNVRIHRAILGRVAARARGGRGPRSDVDQARARLASAMASLASARANLGDAKALYIQAVGEEPGALQNAAAPAAALPANIDGAVAIARAEAPSVMARAADVRAARAAVGVARSRFMPTVNIELTGSLFRGANVGSSSSFGETKEFTALIVGRWNIYRGGIDTARKREAVARLHEARDRLNVTRREVAQQTTNSWNALTAARFRLVALRRQLNSNRRVRLAYSRQFDRGQRTLLDLVDIQNEIFNNETAVTTELFTIKFGAYRTLATMGKLLQTLNIRLPIEGVRRPTRGLMHGVGRRLRKTTSIFKKKSK